MAKNTKSPWKSDVSEEFFGFRTGTDRKIARWDKIVEYFYKIESESDKIKVVDMGKTTGATHFSGYCFGSGEPGTVGPL